MEPITLKEHGFEIQVKNDAVSITGVWLPFPSGVVQTGRGLYAAGLLLHLMQKERDEEEKGKKARKETPHEKGQRLLDEVMARIVRDDADDLAVVLAL